MRLFREFSKTVLVDHGPPGVIWGGIGNEFRFRVTPGFGLQLLQLCPTDCRVLTLGLPGMPPSRNRKVGELASQIELTAGQIFRYPPELVGKNLEFTANDYVRPQLQPPNTPSACIAVLEDRLLLDRHWQPPESIIDADNPFRLGLYVGGGGGNPAAGGAMHDLSSSVVSAPVWMGDGNGRVVFHVDVWNGAVGKPSGTLRLMSYQHDSLPYAGGVITAGMAHELTWATTPVAADVDLHAVYNATRAMGPWLRWEWVYAAGAPGGGPERVCTIDAMKVRGRQ